MTASAAAASIQLLLLLLLLLPWDEEAEEEQTALATHFPSTRPRLSGFLFSYFFIYTLTTHPLCTILDSLSRMYVYI